MRGHILLVGFMGAGKSAAGRELARRLGRPFVDLDRRIEASAGARISEIFENLGEDGFRALETRELQALQEEPASVVACGGGIVTRDENLELLDALGSVVYLGVGVDEALRRIGSAESRPLLAGDARGEAERLLSARVERYREAADVAVDTDGKRVPEVVEEIVLALDQEVEA